MAFGVRNAKQGEEKRKEEEEEEQKEKEQCLVWI
jgi:hypothetical protein